MTILCTYKTKNRIYLACDTQVTKDVKSNCKTKWHPLEISEDTIIPVGCTGYAQFGDFIEHGFKPPRWDKNEEDFEDYLHNELSPALTKEIISRNISKVRDGELDTESEFIFVYDDVYSLVKNCSPLRIRDKFYAAGTGSEIAYGAYYSYSRNILFEEYTADVEELLDNCVSAAQEYNLYCGGDVVISIFCIPGATE